MSGLRSDGGSEPPAPEAPQTPPVGRRPRLVRGGVPVDVLLVVVLCVAVVGDLAHTPVWVRSVLCLPILVGVPGYAVLRTLTGLDRQAVSQVGAAPLWGLTALFGLVGLLADALALSALHLRLTSGSLVAGDAVLSVLLLGGSRWVLHRYAPADADPVGDPRMRWRQGGAALTLTVVAVAVLVGAITIARHIQPTTRQPYAALALTGSAAQGGLHAAPDVPVVLHWGLSGYDGFGGFGGFGAAGGRRPQVAVLVTDVRTGLTTAPPTATAAGVDSSGTTAFPAPAAAGDYRVTLEVTAGSAAALQVATDLTVAG